MRRIAALVLAAAALRAVASPVAVHPSGPTVPENLLRIELRFDRPQPLPFDVARLRLVDADGVADEAAFLDLALPNADGRHITVLMNPGRVKTGVAPHVARGRALHEGAVVRLVLDGDPAAVKTWGVTAPVSVGPRPAGWTVAAPRAGTRHELAVRLHAPVSASAEGFIAVRDDAGRRVPGHTRLSDGDTVWWFRPDTPWRRGAHAVVTHPDLEDPAGNRVCSAFEQPSLQRAPCDAVSVGFAVR